jgi:purine-binding chemotaxis protein CheW
MGRMADARKRSRRPGGKAAAPPPEPAAPPGATEADTAAPATEEAGSPEKGSLVLPSSGLAAEVLAKPEAAAIAPEAAPPPPEPVAEPTAPEEAAPAAPRGAQSLSFFAAPAQEQRAATEDTEHLATFVLDREEYGIDVRQVQEIRRVGEITSVPRAPEFVRGVINLRGRILPVLDLKRKLGLGDVALERAARIVVVRTQGRMLGLLVDGASQVLKVPISRVEPPPEEVVERGGDYIRAVAKLDDRLIILIDLERILAQELREAPAAAGA